MIPASHEQVETVARAKITASAVQRTFKASDAERIVFEAAGCSELANRIWHDARRIGDDAKRGARQSKKDIYGGRAPGSGWIGAVLILAAICAAISAAMCSGFRADPESREIAAVALAVVAGVLNLVTLVGMKLRPLGGVLWRVQAVVAGALILAAGFTLSRGAIPAGVIIAGCAAVSVLMLVVMLAVRAAKPAEAAELDSATARAYLAAIEGSEVAALALQARVTDELDPELARFLVRVRTAAFANLPEQVTARANLSRYDESVPAGGVIIADFADPKTWLPSDLAKKA